MQGTVLLYNIREKDSRKQLRRALAALELTVIYVYKKDYLKPVGTLAGEPVFVTVDQEYDGPEFEAGMLVMAGLDGGGVDRVLQALRESGTGGIPYKAVLTPTNRFWTSVMLYEELKKEHQAFGKE